MFKDKIFSLRLSALRKAHNLTLQQLGDAISLTKSAVGNLEHNRKKPSLDIVCALADYFNVSIDYLVGRSDNPQRP